MEIVSQAECFNVIFMVASNNGTRFHRMQLALIPNLFVKVICFAKEAFQFCCTANGCTNQGVMFENPIQYVSKFL